MHDLKLATGSAVNFNISGIQRRRSAHFGRGLPDIHSIPAGSLVMLNLEPASDETNTLMPGLRVGEELWQLEWGLEKLASLGLTLMPHLSIGHLKVMKLTTGLDECMELLGNAAAAMHACDINTPLAFSGTPQLLPQARTLWQNIDDAFFVDSTESIANAKTANKEGEPSLFMNMRAVLLGVSYGNGLSWNPKAVRVEYDEMAKVARTALYRARHDFKIPRRMISIPWHMFPAITASQPHLAKSEPQTEAAADPTPPSPDSAAHTAEPRHSAYIQPR
jgi:hypothetical protein